MLKKLEDAGYEAYLVGGCVRDALLGRKPGDWDITTNARPDEIEALFENVPIEGADADIERASAEAEGDGCYGRVYKTITVGKEHGTIGVVVPLLYGEKTSLAFELEAELPQVARSEDSEETDKKFEVYEVTTYRIDGEYSDNRHPDSVEFARTLEEDVKRRDFTVNALAMDREGKVLDYVGGLEDLDDCVIRAVGDPKTRFDEDALRILRGIRFSAQLKKGSAALEQKEKSCGSGQRIESGFKIEKKTAQAIHEKKHLLHNIAAERIQVELNKILMSEGAVTVLREYRDVFAEFIPELAEGFGFDQQNPYHCYDVYEHILHAVEAVPQTIIPVGEADPKEMQEMKEAQEAVNKHAYMTVRLAALLHDIGKPACFVIKDGWGHFYGHEHASADMARDILNRLRYDNKTKDDVVALIKAHGTVFNLDERYARRKLNQFGEERLRMLIALERADVSAQAEYVERALGRAKSDAMSGKSEQAEVESVRAARIKHIETFSKIVDKVIADAQCFSLKDLAIDGRDLIAAGITDGPEIGRTLSRLLDAVIDGELPNEREKLLSNI